MIDKDFNPSIESYAVYFCKLDLTKPDAAGWTKVGHPVNLKPGDVCLWLKPTTLDIGPMWIIAGGPNVNPKRTMRCSCGSLTRPRHTETIPGQAQPIRSGSALVSSA